MYHAGKVAIDPPAIERACIVFTPISSYQRAIATGEYGVAARTMMLPNKQSRLHLAKTLPRSSLWPLADSFLISSRSRTRSVIVKNRLYAENLSQKVKSLIAQKLECGENSLTLV